MCNGSCSPRRTISIACVSPVMANPAGVTIAVKNITIGVTVASIVCLIACGYRRSLSAAIVCDD